MDGNASHAVSKSGKKQIWTFNPDPSNRVACGKRVRIRQTTIKQFQFVLPNRGDSNSISLESGSHENEHEENQSVENTVNSVSPRSKISPIVDSPFIEEKHDTVSELPKENRQEKCDEISEVNGVKNPTKKPKKKVGMIESKKTKLSERPKRKSNFHRIMTGENTNSKCRTKKMNASSESDLGNSAVELHNSTPLSSQTKGLNVRNLSQSFIDISGLGKRPRREESTKRTFNGTCSKLNLKGAVNRRHKSVVDQKRSNQNVAKFISNSSKSANESSKMQVSAPNKATQKIIPDVITEENQAAFDKSSRRSITTSQRRRSIVRVGNDEATPCKSMRILSSEQALSLDNRKKQEERERKLLLARQRKKQKVPRIDVEEVGNENGAEDYAFDNSSDVTVLKILKSIIDNAIIDVFESADLQSCTEDEQNGVRYFGRQLNSFFIKQIKVCLSLKDVKSEWSKEKKRIKDYDSELKDASDNLLRKRREVALMRNKCKKSKIREKKEISDFLTKLSIGNAA